jgi:hypothetical protein
MKAHRDIYNQSFIDFTNWDAIHSPQSRSTEISFGCNLLAQGSLGASAVVVIVLDDNKKYGTTEPVKPGYLSSAVSLTAI